MMAVSMSMGKFSPDLLKRYTNGSCTEAEKAEVEYWLENGDEDIDAISLKKVSLETEIWEGIVTQAQPVPTAGAFRRFTYLAAASVFILSGLFLWYQAKSPGELVVLKTVTVPIGQRMMLKLADHSSVELSGGSEISYPDAFEGESREVTLIEGEAFFSVSHNTEKPFLVHTSGASIRVLGTKFNVENFKGDNQLSVTLTQGSISFQGKSGGSALLIPGQQLVFLKKQQKINAITSIDTNRVTSWTKGVLWFDHTPVSNVLEKLERHYGVHFENPDGIHLDGVVTAKFKEQPLSRVLHLIENFTDLKFNQQGKHVNIYTSIR